MIVVRLDLDHVISHRGDLEESSNMNTVGVRWVKGGGDLEGVSSIKVRGDRWVTFVNSGQTSGGSILIRSM